MADSSDKYDEIFNAVINNAVNELEVHEHAVFPENESLEHPVDDFQDIINHEPILRETESTPKNSDDDDEGDSYNAPILNKKRKKHNLKKMNLKPRKLTYPSQKSVHKKQKTKKDKMIEKEKRKRNGTWVQCCNTNCQKWRYVEEYKDPISVPDKWYCNMNPDTLKQDCEKPEEDETEDFIFTKYTSGSVVWATIEGYPSWPAMVEEDPDTETYCEVDEDNMTVPTHYHVVFFDTHVSRAWVKAANIQPFYKDKVDVKTSYGKRNYRYRMKTAILKASEAVNLPIEERIEKCGFAHTYDGSWPVDQLSNDSNLLEAAERQVQELEKLQSLTLPKYISYERNGKALKRAKAETSNVKAKPPVKKPNSPTDWLENGNDKKVYSSQTINGKETSNADDSADLEKIQVKKMKARNKNQQPQINAEAVRKGGIMSTMTMCNGKLKLSFKAPPKIIGSRVPIKEKEYDNNARAEGAKLLEE